MDKTTNIAKKYENCMHIQKEEPHYVDEATLESFTRDSDFMPLFEMKRYISTRILHYSMKTNKLLQCRWKEFLNTLGGRQRTPVIFPNNRDIHFYKCQTKFEPSQSLFSREHFRKHLHPGPGVDAHGQVPIPNEMHVRK